MGLGIPGTARTQPAVTFSCEASSQTFDPSDLRAIEPAMEHEYNGHARTGGGAQKTKGA